MIKALPKVADFLSLGTGFFFMNSVISPQLHLKAWTLDKPLPAFRLDLPPPFRLRLSAGVPQLLRGAEKAPLIAFASKFTKSPGLPLALPFLSDTQVLLGALILMDCPPFDLEEEAFVLAWTQLKYTFLQSLAPKPRARSSPVAVRLNQTLAKGHQLLVARIETQNLMRHAESVGLFPQRVKALLAAALGELAGEQGAVVEQSPLLTAFFVLPGKMDKDLLWHQILSALTWPQDYLPRWELTVVKTPAELSRFLGK